MKNEHASGFVGLLGVGNGFDAHIRAVAVQVDQALQVRVALVRGDLVAGVARRRSTAGGSGTDGG